MLYIIYFIFLIFFFVVKQSSSQMIPNNNNFNNYNNNMNHNISNLNNALNNNNNNVLRDAVVNCVKELANDSGSHFQEILFLLNKKGISASIMDIKKIFQNGMENGTMYAGATDDHICVI